MFFRVVFFDISPVLFAQVEQVMEVQQLSKKISDQAPAKGRQLDPPKICQGWENGEFILG